MRDITWLKPLEALDNNSRNDSPGSSGAGSSGFFYYSINRITIADMV
jgi:hypothetical protein